MTQWLPLSTTTFQTIVEIIPPPQIAQALRMPKMLHPDSYSTASSQLPTSKLERDLYKCDPAEDANVVVYVSKMFAIKKTELPENRVKVVTAEEMREEGRRERQRRAEERQREMELDKEGLIGMESDGKAIGGGKKTGPSGVPIGEKPPGAEEDEGEKEVTPGLTFVSGAQPVKPKPKTASPPSSPKPIILDLDGPNTPLPSSSPNSSAPDEALIGFARLYSGTLRLGTTLTCLLPKYDTTLPATHPRNAKYVTKVTMRSLYMMMGRDLVAVETVPAGNVFAVGGLEGKVWRNATLCAPSGRGVKEGQETEGEGEGLVNLAGVIMAVSVVS